MPLIHLPPCPLSAPASNVWSDSVKRIDKKATVTLLGVVSTSADDIMIGSLTSSNSTIARLPKGISSIDLAKEEEFVDS